MKITVDSHIFRNAFERTRPNQFSHAALGRLFDYYSMADDDSGTETELDVVAICCDWTEYSNAVEAAEACGWTSEEQREDKSEIEAFDWLTDRTHVIDCEESVLVLNF